MAVYEIQNETLTLQVESHGAEIRSLKKDGKEYMWCGDSAYWGRVSPVLFPLVGGVKGKAFRSKGATYPMGQHGFARDMEFTLIEKTEHRLSMRLASNEETLAKYPYAFVLDIVYTLIGNGVEVLWKVTNPAEEVLHFSIGAHPAFVCEPEGYAFYLYKQTGDASFEKLSELAYQKLNAEGLLVRKNYVEKLVDGKLPISKNLFAEDALIVEGGVNRVTIADAQGKEYLGVDFTSPLVGLWSPAGKSAPFVCIEPWYGRCDEENFAGTWEEREWGNNIAGGETFERSYQINVLA